MFKFVIMRHRTGEVTESALHYKFPHTAFFGARDYIKDELEDKSMSPTDPLSLGIEDEKGRLTDARMITIEFSASDMLKEKTYRKLLSKRLQGVQSVVQDDNKPYWCPQCHSHNIRQLGSKGRPWHCSDCGYEFPDIGNR